MEFTDRKLPLEAAESLRRCPIATVHPYALMPAPVYLFLKLNQKFVSIKGPLDFFSPSELDRYRSAELVFFPPSVDLVLPFQTAGRRVRAISSWTGGGELPPTAYEVSDAILQVLGSLWWRSESGSMQVDPFFTVAYANEVIAPCDPELLMSCRERDARRYELAMVRGATIVFLLNHLGVMQVHVLQAARERAIRECMGMFVSEALLRLTTEHREIFSAMDAWVPSLNQRALTTDSIESRKDEVSRKILVRLERVSSELRTWEGDFTSIQGGEGFQKGAVA